MVSHERHPFPLIIKATRCSTEAAPPNELLLLPMKKRAVVPPLYVRMREKVKR